MRNLLLPLLFVGLATTLPGSPASRKDQPGQAIKDSIRLYDSLSFASCVRHNELSIVYARKELLYARKAGDPLNICKACSSLGTAFFSGQKDSSLFYFNIASGIARQNNLFSQKPLIFYNLAMISMEAADLKNAILLLDSCIVISKKNSKYEILSDAYNSFGEIQLELNDSLAAKQYFTKALEIGREYSLSHETGVALSNLALFEKEKRKSTALRMEAFHYLDRQSGSEQQAALVLINIADVQENNDSALFYYHRALKVSVNANLPVVEIAACNNMANRYLEMNNMPEAKKCLDQQALPLAKKINNLDWLSTIYDTYADLAVKSKNFEEAFHYERLSMDTTCRRKH
jgi:tetratricopeptide (TPR) repeat protein